MKKKITLTDEHLLLIQNINIEEFEIGELFSTTEILDCIEDIESSPESMEKFGQIRDSLVKVKDRLETISENKTRHAWGADQWNLFGGTYVMEDVALILGRYGDYIPGTEDSPNGKQYPKELEDHWWDLYTYIWTNMVYIMKLVLYYSNRQGIHAGTYVYDTKTGEWEAKDE